MKIESKGVSRGVQLALRHNGIPSNFGSEQRLFRVCFLEGGFLGLVFSNLAHCQGYACTLYIPTFLLLT